MRFMRSQADDTTLNQRRTVSERVGDPRAYSGVGPVGLASPQYRSRAKNCQNYTEVW